MSLDCLLDHPLVQALRLVAQVGDRMLDIQIEHGSHVPELEIQVHQGHVPAAFPGQLHGQVDRQRCAAHAASTAHD